MVYSVSKHKCKYECVIFLFNKFYFSVYILQIKSLGLVGVIKCFVRILNKATLIWSKTVILLNIIIIQCKGFIFYDHFNVSFEWLFIYIT